MPLIMEIPLLRPASIITCAGLCCFLLFGESCSSVSSNSSQNENEIALPVYEVDTGTVILTKSFLGTVEGKINVEIRPQVGGELEEAYVDEGDYVQKGQKLFQINPQTFDQDLNQAVANENVEKAKLDNARLEVERLKPLVENEVISPVRLKKARSDYEVAEASLKQAAAEVANAKIKLGYTTIKAPVSGYIGRIPKRIGNLVNPGDKEPITVLTDVHEVYVYFSISESNFYKLLQTPSDGDEAGESITEHIDTNRVVSLLLSDGTLYPWTGVIDASSGQVNKSTGTILMRASFPNEKNILRSGNTGTVVLNQQESGKIIIPQKATYELQAKTFVEKLDAGNRVSRRLITIGASAPDNRYIVRSGLNIGDRILVGGLDKVTDSMKIKPLAYHPDTLVAPRVFSHGSDSIVTDSF